MKKIKYLLLLSTILILLVGVSSATEVSENITDTNSNTDEAVMQDTYKVSDTAKDIQTNKASDNNIDKNTTKIDKTIKNTNVKTDAPITNWKELQSAVKSAADKKENVTLTLENGTYINTDLINLKTKNRVLQ